jgi:hypothetical protein
VGLPVWLCCDFETVDNSWNSSVLIKSCLRSWVTSHHSDAWCMMYDALWWKQLIDLDNCNCLVDYQVFYYNLYGWMDERMSVIGIIRPPQLHVWCCFAVIILWLYYIIMIVLYLFNSILISNHYNLFLRLLTHHSSLMISWLIGCVAVWLFAGVPWWLVSVNEVAGLVVSFCLSVVCLSHVWFFMSRDCWTVSV